ncbi:hypothetical protein J4466_01035 [Candidatus Pacearchaeota archaeon]|nr:hypothetical protein [Candidatus Pacearchaeota archaeon]
MADEQLKQQRIPKEKAGKEIKNKEYIAQASKAAGKLEKENVNDKKIDKTEESKAEEVKEQVKKKDEKKIKRTEATIYGRNLPISLRHSVAIGRFIRNKKIPAAISDLEKVIKKKVAIPVVGEMAHRRGKGMMSGKYHVNASKEFINLLKTLSANSSVNGMDLDRTIIYETIPNKAPVQHHRFGSTKFKRTHVLIKAKEMERENDKK